MITFDYTWVIFKSHRMHSRRSELGVSTKALRANLNLPLCFCLDYVRSMDLSSHVAV
jgi:hypothetical protein